jgi:serine/threonine protein kinase
VRCLKSWHPPGVSEVVSGGNIARLSLLPDGTIHKYVYDGDDRWAMKGLDIEHHVLVALGSHERLIKYCGPHVYGFRFRFESNGDIRRYFSRTDSKTISTQQRRKWVDQAAESVAFIHSKDVIHCKVAEPKVKLVVEEEIVRVEVAGSLFGELDGKAMESTPFFVPRDPPNTKSDFFALESVMYYIMAGRGPYDGLSEDEITACDTRGDFPYVDEFECGQTISGCWTGKSNSALEVVTSL